jgi:hypothetical protein
MPDDIQSLIAQCQAAARVEATRADGSVDDVAEALAFRRLVVEAAAAWPETDTPRQSPA